MATVKRLRKGFRFSLINLHQLQLTDNLDVWRSLTGKYAVEIFCGLFMESSMEGIRLSSKSLLALGERGIEIDFDMYGPDDEDL